MAIRLVYINASPTKGVSFFVLEQYITVSVVLKRGGVKMKMRAFEGSRSVPIPEIFVFRMRCCASPDME